MGVTEQDFFDSVTMRAALKTGNLVVRKTVEKSIAIKQNKKLSGPNFKKACIQKNSASCDKAHRL